MSDPSVPKTRRNCTATTSAGNPCGKRAAQGATVCHSHGARAPQVAKRAIVRAELEAWGLTDQTVDPGVMLLRLVAQSARRAARYADLLEADYADKQIAALIGSVSGEDGHKSGEYIKGLAALEAAERDRCANFAAKAVTAGVAERSVRVAEQLGGALTVFVRALLTDLGRALADGQIDSLDPDNPVVRELVSQQFRALPA